MEKGSGLSLITKTELLNFPSASSIEFHNDLLYIIGDDARNIAIIDKNYKLLDTVTLFPGDSLRIPKKIKADLEASTIVRHNGKDALLVTGSASTPEREFLWLFPLENLNSHEKISLTAFIGKLRVKQVNFEGLAAVKNMLVFGNRGNINIPENQLVIVPVKDLTALENTNPVIIEMKLDGSFKGLSGLAYVPSDDLLLFTASVEETGSAYEDGKIGNSYLGYIKNFSSKLNEKILRADELIDLPATQHAFLNEKIESVAVEAVGKNLILHLVADNDNGTSTLFKLSLPTP
jgi:hypothetical protein